MTVIGNIISGLDGYSHRKVGSDIDSLKEDDPTVRTKLCMERKGGRCMNET